MNCSDIRKHLLQNTQLTKEEEIAFIEQNLSSSKSLRSYIDAQHYGVKEMTFLAKSVSDMTEMIGKKTYAMYTELFQASNLDSDEDCKYLQSVLSDYYAGKNKDSRWNRVMGAAKGILDIAKTGAGMVYNAAAQAVSYAQVAVSWALTTGFKLWVWVASNPQTAYFSLLCMKEFKNNMCSEAGNYISQQGIKLDNKDSLLWFIKNTTGIPPPENTNIQELYRLCYEVALPGLTTFVGQLSGKMIEQILSKGGEHLGTLLSTGLSFIPGVGTVLGGSIGFVMGVVCKSAGQDLKIQAEQMAYMTNVKNTFKLLLELINPFECLMKMNQAMFQTMQGDEMKKLDTKINKARLENGDMNAEQQVNAIKYGEADRDKEIRKKFNNCRRVQSNAYSNKEKKLICEKEFTAEEILRLRAFKDTKKEVVGNEFVDEMNKYM